MMHHPVVVVEDRERKGGGGGLKFSREGNAINNRGGVVRFSVTPQQASRR